MVYVGQINRLNSFRFIVANLQLVYTATHERTPRKHRTAASASSLHTYFFAVRRRCACCMIWTALKSAGMLYHKQRTIHPSKFRGLFRPKYMVYTEPWCTNALAAVCQQRNFVHASHEFKLIAPSAGACARRLADAQRADAEMHTERASPRADMFFVARACFGRTDGIGHTTRTHARRSSDVCLMGPSDSDGQRVDGADSAKLFYSDVCAMFCSVWVFISRRAKYVRMCALWRYSQNQ